VNELPLNNVQKSNASPRLSKISGRQKNRGRERAWHINRQRPRLQLRPKLEMWKKPDVLKKPG
jgi:hypothetical protein